MFAIILAQAIFGLTNPEFTAQSSNPPETKHLAAITGEANGSERIDYAGKLKMLSQRAPAAACNKAAGIGGWLAKGYLAASIGEFDRIMNALENGDVFLGIRNAENDRRILGRIEQMKEIWTPARNGMEALIEGTATDAQIVQAAGSAPVLLGQIDKMMGDLVGEYADPAELIAADAIVLDIVGRQRMMPQIISKAACMVAEGIDSERAATELRDAMALYDLSMNALLNGMPEAGVTPPPTDAIREQLTAIIAEWQQMRPVLEDVAAGTTPDDATREDIFLKMNDLTHLTNDLSAAYAKASKQNL
ncbi:type IV pili methyl-accepting chemotaxis transducer N-terminal domain-containing protein [Jannaschia aquimarina]|uniref:NarX-like N-terminal domain-containing protein n=1 Tax=Jannaschia aquimarina TaxID=935700 RepID=A0A0D1CNS1_9RHOB|nr:type IV pili methyl-accepting chemotaxis transducer N-terminal domain-containing protein [Jannaschia aquimarina]KIT16362.1 hypothetical protein jaqu_19580 [Jannaschia aquimarina]SNT25581.1 Type IV pili methyl-accepting chemotaxis transducer N-term [Jannaschia aquimarina]